jgi:hypothetical protein
MHRSQRETADSVKQTAHRQHTIRCTGIVRGPHWRFHFVTACTTVRVVLTAAWAV